MPFSNVVGITLARYRLDYRSFKRQLFRFIESAGQRTRLTDALQQYYALDDDLELVCQDLLQESEEKERVFPWLAWDYRHPQCGRSLGEDFLRLGLDSVTPLQHEFGSALLDSTTRFYRVLELCPGIGASVSELGSEAVFFVHDDTLPADVAVTDLILARIVRLREFATVDSIYAYLPSQYEDSLAPYMARAGESPSLFKHDLPETLSFIARLQDLNDDGLALAAIQNTQASAERLFRLSELELNRSTTPSTKAPDTDPATRR
ncbi:MAG: hypothetical protein KC609_21545 [Myxococcales bacterium]|nr:hypothetical protein [Myxococcales bacterium]